MVKIKRLCRRFYRTHREGCETAGDVIGALSIALLIYVAYMAMWMVGGM